jgi:hypothetical protein
MNQVATLNRAELPNPLELHAIPLDKGPIMLETYLSYQRAPGGPSKIYPFTPEGLMRLTEIACEQIGDTKYDPGNLLACAFKVTCDALLREPDPAPIGPKFVEHVLQGTPLPITATDGDDEEPDIEVAMTEVECPCSCHDGNNTSIPHDVMGRKNGQTGEIRSYRCATCNMLVAI